MKKNTIGLLALAQFTLAPLINAQTVTWAAGGPGGGITVAPGRYFATNATDFFDATWTGSGMTADPVYNEPGMFFDNSFPLLTLATTPLSQVDYVFSSPLLDADGVVDMYYQMQRGDYAFTLQGGAVWTSSALLADITGNGGYSLTSGLGTNTLTYTRDPSPNTNDGFSLYAMDFRLGISGSFTGLSIRYTPDGDVTFPTGFGTVSPPVDFVGLKFGELQVIPEPSSAAILGIVGVLGILRRRRSA